MIQKNYAKNLDDTRLKLNKELRDKESTDMENKEYDKVFELALGYKQQ